MITVRPSNSRGKTDIGWLDSRHTFSFSDYYDPAYTGFGPLLVINDDRVAPAKGFGTHPHKDMEIISYVVSGELQHKDSMGTGSTIRRGDVQRMTAGTGVLHSEFNPSPDQKVHFLQIWITPEKRGLTPSYEQKAFGDADKRGQLRLVASRDGREGSVTVHQDVSLYAGLLGEGEGARVAISKGRTAWVQVASGRVAVNGVGLGEGDGAAVKDETELEIVGREPSEILLFDLAS